MEKIIIHSNISNISYAFTVAEMAYRQFEQDRCGENITRRKYEYPDGIVAVALSREKSVTIIVDYGIDIDRLVEVVDDK